MTLLATIRYRTFAAALAAVIFGAGAGLLARPMAGVAAAGRAGAGAEGEERTGSGAAVSAAVSAAVAVNKPAGMMRSPVVVELFTSEGCSSCPTADGLLARLEREQPVPAAEILALEEHVDYWDSLGWRDRFSSSEFSARQSTYTQRLLVDGEYTPQMIVDGTDQFAGSDVVHALRAIGQAASAPKLALTLSPVVIEGGKIAGSVTLTRAGGTGQGADVFAAVVQPMASTKVLSGENGGQTLHHVSVVRELERIGSLESVRTHPLKFALKLPGDGADSDSKELRVVVFVQRVGQGAVLGAVSGEMAR